MTRITVDHEMWKLDFQKFKMDVMYFIKYYLILIDQK